MKENFKKLIEIAEKQQNYELAKNIHEILYSLRISSDPALKSIPIEIAKEYRHNKWVNEYVELYYF